MFGLPHLAHHHHVYSKQQSSFHLLEKVKGELDVVDLDGGLLPAIFLNALVQLDLFLPHFYPGYLVVYLKIALFVAFDQAFQFPGCLASNLAILNLVEEIDLYKTLEGGVVIGRLVASGEFKKVDDLFNVDVIQVAQFDLLDVGEVLVGYLKKIFRNHLVGNLLEQAILIFS